MLQRFAEGILLLIAFYPIGQFLYSKSFGRQRANLLEALVTSYFFYALAGSIFAFFVPVGRSAFYLLLLASIGILVYSNDIRKTVMGFKWIPLLVILLSSSAFAAFPVKLPDEATYYLQSIYGIKEGGWIQGIANLEPRFALGSSFHLVGATTTLFGNAPLKLNVLLLAAAAYRVVEGFENNKPRSSVYWALVSLAGLPVYFLLIPSQSPDILSIFVFALLVEYFFVKHTTEVLFPSLLFGVAILLKPTVALSVAIVMLTRLVWRGNLMAFVKGSIWWLLPVLVLLLKNIRMSGYPLFPLSAFPIDLPWTVPKEALENAVVYLKEGHVSTISDSSPKDAPRDLYILFFKLGAKSVLLWIAVAGLFFSILLSILKREKRLLEFTIAVLVIFPVWLTLNEIPNFRLGMHFIIPLIACAFTLTQAWRPELMKLGRNVVLSAFIVFGLAGFVIPTIDFSGFVANPDYNKFEPLAAKNILVPRAPVFPESYCGNKTFPCVSFDLYPAYSTYYSGEGEYYYLRKD